MNVGEGSIRLRLRESQQQARSGHPDLGGPLIHLGYHLGYISQSKHEIKLIKKDSDG